MSDGRINKPPDHTSPEAVSAAWQSEESHFPNPKFRQATDSAPRDDNQQTVRLQVCIFYRSHRNRKRNPSNKRFSLLQDLYGNPSTATMSHESVWYSRPRTYGKGSREWCVFTTTRSPALARENRRSKRWNILVLRAHGLGDHTLERRTSG